MTKTKGMSTFNILEKYGKIVPLGNSLISESGGSLSRVWKHMKEGSFIVLTAYRGDLTYSENQQRNADLIADLRQHKLGGLQMIGHWVETDDEGNERPVNERSFLVPLTNKATNDDGTEMDSEDLLELGQKLGKRYDQEAILYGDENFVYAVDLNDDSHFKIGDTKTLQQDDLGDMYSQVKNKMFKFGFKESTEFKPFVFDGYVAPTSANVAAIMERAGVYK